MNCNSCGAETIARPRVRLITVGVTMLASSCLAYFFPALWPPAIILALTGLYLLAWALLGQGYWCRNCKRFNLP